MSEIGKCHVRELVVESARIRCTLATHSHIMADHVARDCHTMTGFHGSVDRFIGDLTPVAIINREVMVEL